MMQPVVEGEKPTIRASNFLDDEMTLLESDPSQESPQQTIRSRFEEIFAMIDKGMVNTNGDKCLQWMVYLNFHLNT